jgi:hypothetical protein
MSGIFAGFLGKALKNNKLVKVTLNPFRLSSTIKCASHAALGKKWGMA